MGSDAVDPAPPPSVRIVIVEDDEVLRSALAQMIERVGGFELSGSASTLADGFDLLAEAPDVVLIDLGLPDGSGLDLIARARAVLPDCRLLVLTVFADVRTVVRAIEAGADGYLLKESDIDQIEAAIRSVLAGEAPISPAVASHILARLRQAPSSSAPAVPAGASLTAREMEILQELAGGRSFREVAQLHGISHHTVGDHVKSIYRKLSVNSRSQAVHKAVRSGIIRIQE